MTQKKMQSLVNSNVLQEKLRLMPEISPNCCQIAELEANLQFMLNSYEAVIKIAVIKKKEFPQISFAVEEQSENQSLQDPQIKIMFTAKETVLDDLKQKFRRIGLSFDRSQPADQTNSHCVSLQDYFRNIVFGISKYAFLDTRIYPEEIQQAIEEDQYLFGDETLPIQKISDYSYIVTNKPKQVEFYKKSMKKSNHFQEFTSLAQANCYFNILSTKQPNENSMINTKLIQLQNLKEIYGVKVCLKIDYKVHIFLEVSFKTEQSLKKFLVENYRRLQRVTFLNISSNILKSELPQESIHTFFSEASKKMKSVEAELGLLEEEVEELDRQFLQSGSTHLAYTLFEQLKHKLELGGDLLCLEPYWCPQLKEEFEQAYKYWEIQNRTLEPVLTPLFSMIKHKIQKEFEINQDNVSLNLFQFVYPGITDLMKLFESKLKPNDQKNPASNKRPKTNILDEFLLKFIKQLQLLNKNERHIAIIISDKEIVPLKTRIADCQYYKNASSKWVDVFNCLTLGLKQKKPDQRTISRVINQVENCRYPQLGCLGCSKFFYYNYTNLISPNKLAPTKIFPLVEKISDYETQILQAICRMLNNHGGIILFNCVRQYKQILPRGSLLSEKDKEAIENKIYYMLSFIFPKPDIANISISFVPLAYHPLTRDLERSYEWYKGEEEAKPNQVYYKPTYLQGLFVTRIKVCPTDPSKVYLHSNGNDYFLYGFKENQRQVSVKRLRQAIKKKMQKQRQNQKLHFKDKNAECPLNHTCSPPDSGVIIDSKGLGKSDTSQTELCLTLDNQYPHMSMIICKAKYLKTIKQRLQEKGVRCEVEIRFVDYKFKSAINTAILYHDCRLEELVRLFRQNVDFCFEDKMVLPIYVTKYVKIEQADSFRLGDVETASKWLKAEFPNERLRLFQYRVQRKPEYYMQTESKLSTLFIYYVFQSFGIRVTFKNPMNLDKLEERQRKERLKQVFVSKNNMESVEREVVIPSEPAIKERSARRTLQSLNEHEEY